MISIHDHARSRAAHINDGSLLARVAVTLFFASLMLAVTARAQDAYTGQWFIENGRNDALHFVLRYSEGSRYGDWGHSSWSTDVSIGSLQGLNQADLNSTSGTNVQFHVVRDAGTFNCVGWAQNGAASGHWTFAANPTFAAELKKRGLSTPAPSEQFDLAMSDVTLGFIDELKASGYHVELTDVIRAGKHGVNLEYVRGMKAAGYKFDDLETLTRMRDHGVTPKYVQEMASYGYKNLPAEDLRRMRDHGVTGEYLHGMEQAGFKSLAADEVVRLRDHGVTPEFIAEMAKAGYTGISAQELSRLRDHGVNAEYISGMAEAGYKDVSASELSRMRDHGVGPTYIRELAQAGISHLGTTELTRMKDHGVDASYIRDMKAAGVTTTDPDDLVRMRDHSVTASFVREAKERGFPTTNPDELIRLRSRGFDARNRSMD